MKRVSCEKSVNKILEELGLGEIINPPVIEFTCFRYEKGEFIASPENKQQYIHIIISGKVLFYAIKNNGQMIPVNSGEKGTIIGDIEYVGMGYTSLFAEAATEVECISINVEKQRDIIDSHIGFLHCIMRSLLQKVYLINESNQIETSIEEKLQGYINTTCKDGVIKNVQSVSLRLGCSRRQLERVIKKMCENNKLKKVRNGYYLVIVSK